MLKPVISFYGSKWRMAHRLGRPQREHVIEPFAGGACYSLYWEPRRVTLLDIDPVVCAVWKYLTRVPRREILSLPVNIMGVEEMKGWCQEAKWLVGWWMNCGVARPALTRSNWARKKQFWPSAGVWSENIRDRLAEQVDHLRHWQIINCSWDEMPSEVALSEAHWHIDPPYMIAGHGYRFNDVDYPALGAWCRRRKGFVQVCENKGANWLPFHSFSDTKGTSGRHRTRRSSIEVVYQQGRLKDDLFPATTVATKGGEKHVDIGTGTGKGNGRQAEAQPARLLNGAGGRYRRTGGRHLEGTEHRGAGLVQHRRRSLRRGKDTAGPPRR